MSRFDDLCEALRAVRVNYNEYRERCFELATELHGGLQEYLEAPEQFVNFFAQEGPLAGRKVDGPSAAMHLRDDGYWGFGLAIDLYEDPTILPYDCMALGFLVKRLDGRFLIKFDHDENLGFQINHRDDSGRVYEYVYLEIRRRYEDSFTKFIAGECADRYGFGS